MRHVNVGFVAVVFCVASFEWKQYIEAVGRTTEQLTIATRFGGFEHWINWICLALMIPN
jgi:hypothetical protein